MMSSKAALVSAFLPAVTFHHLLLSGTILFSTKNSGVLAQANDPIFPDDFSWSMVGVPSGYDCIQITESTDPHTWDDNYFCSKQEKDNPGMEWSSNGAISGMRCTHILEEAEVYSATWDDNYLCVPHSSPLYFAWSSNGPIDNEDCIHWE